MQQLQNITVVTGGLEVRENENEVARCRCIGSAYLGYDSGSAYHFDGNRIGCTLCRCCL